MNNQEIEHFFTGLDVTLESVKRANELYEPVVTYNFNPLNFFHPGENKTSEIIAFFLNPNKPHAQRFRFLNAFLTELDITDRVKTYEHVKVVTEQVTHNSRRIDICISFDYNRFGIGIENKIWAIDQDLQLHDYKDYLSNTYKDYLLIYLTPNGVLPSETSIERELFNNLERERKLKVFSYIENIFRLIAEWQNISESERVRHFLNDFQKYLQQKISGESFMNEHSIVTKYIIEKASSPKNVELALSIADASDQLKIELLNILNRQLQKVAAELSLTCHFTVDLEKSRYTGFRFYHSELQKHNIAIVFEFELNKLTDLYFGLAGIGPDNPINPSFKNSFQVKILDAMGTKNNNQNWIFWKYFNEIRVWQKDQFVQIPDGKMAEIIKSKVEEILTMLKNINAISVQ